MRKDSTTKCVSLAIWIPLVWYVIVSSRNISHWLGLSSDTGAEVNYLEGSPIDRMVFSALIFLGLIVLLCRRIDWPRILNSNRWLLLLFIYMGISISWSDYEVVSFKRWFRSIGVLVMVLIVLTEKNPIEAFSRLLRRCYYVLLPLSIILIKYYRDIGVAWTKDGSSEMWIGVTTHKNHLGEVAMMGGIFFIWSILRNRKKSEVYVSILFLLLVFYILNGSGTSASMTAIYTFIAGNIILIWLQRLRLRPECVTKHLATLLFIIMFIFLAFEIASKTVAQDSFVAGLLEASGRDITFTGRTDLWNDLLYIASSNPFLGVGYGSFWIGNVAHNLWEKNLWLPQQGHNGYIDTYLELGILGIILLITALISIYKRIQKTFHYEFEFGMFRITTFLMILVSNIFESSFLRGSHNLWFMFLLIAVSVPLRKNNEGYIGLR